MPFTTIQPFPFAMTPLSNVTPFTYRDGQTFQEKLELMRVWLNQSLVPETEALLANAIDEYQTGVKNAEQTVITAKAGWKAEFDAFVATTNAAIDAFETGINADFASFTNSVNQNMTGHVNDIEATKTEWTTKWDTFIANVDLELQALNDSAVATLANNPASALGTALRNHFAETNTGKGVGLVYGVVRNYADGAGWVPLTDGFHPPSFINAADSLTNPAYIEVKYPGAGARTGSLVATADETLAKAGFIAGGSVDNDKARIQLAQWRMLSDYGYYDTADSTFKLWHDVYDQRGLNRSPFTVGSWTNGHLTLTHKNSRIRDESFAVIVERVGGPGENYLPVLSTSWVHGDITNVVIDFYAQSMFGSKGHDWGVIGDGSTAATGITVPGAQMGDFVDVSMDVAIPDGMVLAGTVTAVDTVRATLYNRSGVTQDLPAGTIRAKTTRNNGADYRIQTADAKCRFRIIAGQYRTYVPPADVNETSYPGGNIWIMGGMQKLA